MKPPSFYHPLSAITLQVCYKYKLGDIPLMPNLEFPPNFRITSISKKPVKATAAIPTTTYTCKRTKQRYVSTYLLQRSQQTQWQLNKIKCNTQHNRRQKTLVVLISLTVKQNILIWVHPVRSNFKKEIRHFYDRRYKERHLQQLCPQVGLEEDFLWMKGQKGKQRVSCDKLSLHSLHFVFIIGKEYNSEWLI